MRIDGPTREDIETASDQFCRLMNEKIKSTLQVVAKSIKSENASVDDVSRIMTYWKAHVTNELLPHLKQTYRDTAHQTRVAQRDALVSILAKNTPAVTASARLDQLLEGKTLDEARQLGRSSWEDVKVQLAFTSALVAAPSSGEFEIPAIPNVAGEQMLEGASNRLVNVGNEVWEHARSELLTGVQAGESVGQLQARVVGATDLAAPRAEVIARTETALAMNTGSIDQMRQIDVPMTKEWIAVGDARTRQTHADADGQKVGINDPFDVGGSPEDTPGEEPNCRCTMGFDVPDDQLASSVCDCGADATPLLASLFASAMEDLGPVCACDTAMPDAELHALSQPGIDSALVANPDEYKSILRQAREKIFSAPTPSAEAVAKAQVELANAKAGVGRAGGESRGGSAASRRKQRLNLFNEFGGEQNGYAVCHGCGTKIHWDTPGTASNPHGYARFERGKIFVKCQGGGYQLANLLPECFACNRTRGDRALRAENGC